jgi:hypothetical protein
MACVRLLRSLVWSAVAALLAAACGGTTLSGPGGEAGAGSAGASYAGAGPAAGASSGGATGDRCSYDGKVYASGQTFLASDGCNGCTCQDDGFVACTTRACEDQCTVLQVDYADALKRAKACDPSQAGQCTAAALNNLPCGCSTPVNAANQKALAELESLKQRADGRCAAVCSPCLSPRPGTCTAAGSCEEAPLRAAASCKVGGIVYPSGTSGISDPTSCNKCSCDDGQLSCTEIGCPKPCPSGTQFGSQCAQCGPTDACQVIEYACLPTCTDSCPTGVCSNGICRQVCG